MAPAQLTAFIGIAAFTLVMSVLYWYATGKGRVAPRHQAAYELWTARYSARLKRNLLILSVLYALGMTVQLFSLL